MYAIAIPATKANRYPPHSQSETKQMNLHLLLELELQREALQVKTERVTIIHHEHHPPKGLVWLIFEAVA